MPDQPNIKCKAECACGWTEVFSRAYSGLLIECPRCGKSHRIPTFDAPDADSAIDMSTMARLLQQDAPETPASTARVLVLFRPLLILSCVIAVIVAALAMILLHGRYPADIAIAGGALSWPIAVCVAWFGQARQLKKMARADSGTD